MRNLNGALLAIVLVLSGCTAGTPPSASKTTGDVPCQPPKSPEVEAEPTFAPVKGGGLRAEPKARFVATREVDNLDISERYVVWVGSDSRDNAERGKWLCLYDLETGDRRELANLRPQGRGKKVLESIGVSGDTVVYTEISQIRSDYFDPKAWATIAIDLKTGKKKELAARTAPGDLEGLPAFTVEWPWVILGGTFPPDINRHKGVEDFRNLVRVDLRSNARSVLVKMTNMEDFKISEGLVAYGDYSEQGKDYCNNIFVVPVDQSAPPKQVTTSCRVQQPVFDSGMVGWHETVTNEREGREGAEDHPWVQVVGSPAIRLSEGGRNVLPGKGYVVWLPGYPDTSGNLVAKDPLSSDSPLVLVETAYLGPRWTTYRDLVAWTTKNIFTSRGPNSNAYVVHVARITKT